MNSYPHVVHVCIATGQNAANLIPLKQLDAQEIWILQTPNMKANAAHLQTALRREGRLIERVDFDDSSPEAIIRSSQDVTLRLDGRQVILHATGGTKLMVLALSEELRLLGTGVGSLDVLYAETRRQQIDWLGRQPRTEPMADVLDLQDMLLVQGYRIEGESRHADAQARAQTRADITRDLGDNAAKHAKYLGALNAIAEGAAKGQYERDLTSIMKHAPRGGLADLLEQAQAKGLLRWDGELAITFADKQAAKYLCGGWLEEFVLLKLTGIARPGYFSINLQIVSATGGVPNEIDAMLVHRNRVLLIECKTRRQDEKVQDAFYKLAQLRERLGGSVAASLYLSARPVDVEVLKRAKEYGIDVLAADKVTGLVAWIRNWQEV
jgi:hypothetical protein